MSDLITDAMVEAAAKEFASHEYRINGPEMVPFCSCGWTATERYGVVEYDQHVTRLTLEAAAPLIAARALMDAVDAVNANPLSVSLLGAPHTVHFLRARSDRIERGES